MTPFHPLIYSSHRLLSLTIPFALYMNRSHQRNLLQGLFRQSFFLHLQRPEHDLIPLGQRKQLLHVLVSHGHVCVSPAPQTHSADPSLSPTSAAAPSHAETHAARSRLRPMKRPFALLSVTLSNARVSEDSAGAGDSSLGVTVTSAGHETPALTFQIESLGSRGDSLQRLLEVQFGFHDSTDGNLP